MVGIGRTVFDGTRSRSSRSTSSASSRTSSGPQRNLILARLEGGPLANTGVIAGMSGSPVYIDGRLIGAVSYSLGSFSKEPIAGITPIDEMTDATALGGAAAGRARACSVEFPLTRDEPDRRRSARRSTGIGRSPTGPSDAALRRRQRASPGSAAASSARCCGRLPRRSSCRASSRISRDMLGGAFREQGFVPTGGSAAGRGPARCRSTGRSSRATRSASMFVNGDLQLGGTGTVTHVDGDRVYAFGHPMYNLGPTEFPMTRAYVYTVLPSLFSSTKLSTTGEVIGTLLQDRATAIAGRLGPGPDA